ncbi:hypothetical protein [Fodinicurvata fenggangensis]|uniref:hypothetical protein n=1 Tax=Fodinicurvata fenggangensis TaxID=1121830 RepID=UPI00047D178C|nr:hypothetical protein [Fodinicurvata fenggangensis]
MRHPKPGSGLVFLLLVFFWPMAAGAFDDCAAGDYLAEVDPRVAGASQPCDEVERFTIETPRGPRAVRLVSGYDYPAADLRVMRRDVRRGVEHSAAALFELGRLAPDDLTIWLSHLLPMEAEDGEGYAHDSHGVTIEVSDGCLVAVYPGVTGARGMTFTMAHEFFHCVQKAEMPVKANLLASDWWVEGTAEWFANLVVPGTSHSQGFIAGFDALSDHVPLTALGTDSVVFFFWLSETFGAGAVADLMAAMPAEEGQSAQQDALAHFLAPDDWQHFAQAYLDQDLRQPGGGGVASTPFPGDIHVWNRSREHSITFDRLVLARAQLEFDCGHWTLRRATEKGTWKVRETSSRDWGELPEEITVEEGSRKRFRLAGYGIAEAEGFRLVLDGRKDPCRGCILAARDETADRCLIGGWELVSGGYGKVIERKLRDTGVFEDLQYPDLQRYLILQADGRYEQSPTPSEGMSSVLSEEGELWQGLASLAMRATGRWSVEGEELRLCEAESAVELNLDIIEPDGDVSRIRESRDKGGAALLRTRRYTCEGNSLSMEEILPGAPAVTWEYQRIE